MTDKENPPVSDQDYLDAAEDFESDIDDLSDAKAFDEDNEDGIFAPSPERKKKAGSKVTAAVVLVALLSGGAFYYLNRDSAGVETPLQSSQAPASMADMVPPVAEKQSGLPGVPAPASDFPQEAVPDATAGETLDQTSPDVVSADATDITSEPVVPPKETTLSSDAPETGISEVGTSMEISPPPVNEAATDIKGVANTETQKTGETSSATVSEQSAEQPDSSVLAPVTSVETSQEINKDKTAVKKNELEAARETINVEEKPAAPTKYFDAPNGKALTDIPPPSINPMKEPGESFIIVHKGKAATDAIIEKGDDSGFIESRLISANRATKLGRNDAALDFYNELYRKNPRDPRILMGRAVTYQKLGETQKAIDGYQDVLDIEPNNPEALTNLMGLIGQTKPAVALQNLLDLRERFPKNASVAAQLGVAYAQSGNSEDGLKYLNIAGGLQPENPLHFFNMAVISERLNDRTNAIRYYEQALDAYAVNGSGTDSGFSREQIYDRLAHLRGN